MAGLFQVLWGNPDRTFRKAETLNGTDGEPLVIPAEGDNWTENICTRPFAVDWDGDGHLDLIVGNFPGTFYLFKGEGQGKFAPQAQQLTSGNEPLRIEGVHSDPFVVDFDGDGDLDILSGSSQGGVQWAENIAGPSHPPELKPFRPLIDAGTSRSYDDVLKEADLQGPASSTRVWAADFDGDGKLDLFVGDRVTLRSPAPGLSEEEMKEKHAQWQAAINELALKMNSSSDEQERIKSQKEFQDLYSRRSEFMTEDLTGFVWLYLRQ